MDEQTKFEPTAVLAPRRARRTRLAVLLPVLALAGIALAGLTGNRLPSAADRATTPVTAAAAGSPPATRAPGTVAQPFPAQVLGLDVHPLDDILLARLTRDDVVAIAGWYVPLAITACPAAVAEYQGGGTVVQPGFDPWAYCERAGVLYAERPGSIAPIAGPAAAQAAPDGPTSIAASLVPGIRLPDALEVVGAAPMQVVVLGHFVEASSACMLLGACPSELVVDYVGWAPGFVAPVPE